MKRIFAGLFASGLVLSLVADPVVIPASVKLLEPQRGAIGVTYRMPGAVPAVITVDIQTNVENDVWASIGDENVRTLEGDVNRVVEPSAEEKTIRWKAHKDWPNRLIDGGKVRAVVEAWSTNAPPPYMTVDLETRAVRFYRSEAALPFAVSDRLAKTRYVVMRRIPAAFKTWRMGTAGTTAVGAGKETAHLVTLTEDYYLGIYPLTQRQCLLLKEKSQYAGTFNFKEQYGLGDDYPAYSIPYTSCRGTRAAGYDWPNTQPLHAVDPKSLLGKLRSYIGQGLEFDLPTEAQWEFACRAGTTGTWNVEGDPADFCWSGGKTQARTVGYSQNAWGIWDMHGNPGQHCLDYWGAYDVNDSIDPKGPTWDPEVTPEKLAAGTVPKRVDRGGYYTLTGANVETYCKSAARYRYNENGTTEQRAVRLCCPAIVSAEGEGPAPIPPGKLVLTFDDQGSIPGWINVLPTFRKYNAHATFFVNGAITDDVKAKMATLAADGHSLGFHGYGHQQVPAYVNEHGADAYIADEIKPQQDAVKGAPFAVNSFAYPSSSRTAETDALLLANGFRRLRGGQNSGRDPSAKPLKDIANAFIAAEDTPTTKVILGNCIISQYAGWEKDLGDAIERIARTGETLPLYAHQIVDGENTSPHNITLVQLETILRKASELGVKAVGFDEL